MFKWLENIFEPRPCPVKAQFNHRQLMNDIEMESIRKRIELECKFMPVFVINTETGEIKTVYEY